MNVANIIEKKRDGKVLSPSEITSLIEGYTDGSVPDYQMSAFAMAVHFQSMDQDETVALTKAMAESGDQLSWPGSTPVVDKHSTGGVGDKISIALAPLLACCDVVVPMISGRGLGSTGGTLDKLESIKGYRTELSGDEFRSVINWSGCSIASATKSLAPADQKLYALRDVTATVPSIPLIVASILSKKFAAGIRNLVLDVKWGSGAFMKTLDDAKALAQRLVDVCDAMDVKATALVTDMNQPLGRMIGNGVEIDESVDILRGEGPDDVKELTLALAGEALVLAGKESSVDSARSNLEKLLEYKDAYKKFAEMVDKHGGDLEAKRERGREHPVTAIESGYISRIETSRLGLAIIEMGGGRKQLGDNINYNTGIESLVRIGDKIEKGQKLATVFCDSDAASLAVNLVGAAYGVSTEKPQQRPLIADRVTNS